MNKKKLMNCRKCNVELTEDNVYRYYMIHHRHICKSCFNEDRRKASAEFKEYVLSLSDDDFVKFVNYNLKGKTREK